MKLNSLLLSTAMILTASASFAEGIKCTLSETDFNKEPLGVVTDFYGKDYVNQQYNVQIKGTRYPQIHAEGIAGPNKQVTVMVYSGKILLGNSSAENKVEAIHWLKNDWTKQINITCERSQF